MISGEHREEETKGKDRERVSEQRYRRFERTLPLPSSLKAEQIEAQYEDGVLKVLIPKSGEEKKHKIKIADGKTGFLHRLLGDRPAKESAASRKGEDQAAVH